MTQELFEKQLEQTKQEIGQDLFVYDQEVSGEYQEIYRFIEDYAGKKQLFYTALSLPLVRGIMSAHSKSVQANLGGITRYRGHYLHALEICKLLISVVLPLSEEEEDLVLAAALAHVIPNVIDFDDVYTQMQSRYHLHPEICRIIELIIWDEDISSQGLNRFFERVKEDKLAMIVLLADRGKLVQQLNTLPLLSANEYIYETRTYLFPLCLYAKEQYPEFGSIITIMLEKVRTVIDACSILLKRYENTEMELTGEILKLKEENASIRRIIKELREERGWGEQ